MKLIVCRSSKKLIKTLISLSLGVFLIFKPAQSLAEALIVLEYNGVQSGRSSGNDSNNAFVLDHNHSV